MAARSVDTGGAGLGGYAFENVCLTHVSCLKRALGISGVQTQHSTWSYRPATIGERGAQIDLLIDRKDGVINLCEMKFSDTAYEISKKYDRELRTKEEIFRRVTGTRKTIFVTIVSPYGVKPNQHAQALVQGVVTADDLYNG